MGKRDTEIEWLKASVNCAALLERLPPVWRLDRAESTRRSLKYRRGEGEIVIVNHDGRGWWDPLSDNKGDIFTLVRHLEPGLTFPDACRALRGQETAGEIAGHDCIPLLKREVLHRNGRRAGASIIEQQIQPGIG